jgi:methyl-accepting chemotaxis protein
MSMNATPHMIAAGVAQPGDSLRPPAGRSALAEFFRYHGLWAPGVRLFRAIGFRSKALVIAITFVLPLTLVSWNYFTGQQAQIDFSAKERLGVAYAKEVMPLLDLLQRQRLYATLSAAKGAAVPELATLDSQMAPHLAKLAEVEKALGAELGTSKAYAAFIDSGKALPSPAAGLDAVFAGHTARVEALLALLGQSTDGSNLTLDPDIDTYYLMDAAMFRVPVIAEAEAQVRGLGAALLAKGAISPAQQRHLIERLAIKRAQGGDLQAGLAKAVAYNADVKAAARTDEFVAAGDAFAALVEGSLLRVEGVQGDVAVHIAAGTKAVEASLALAQRASAQLDILIAARVERLETARNVAAAVLVLSLFAAWYLFVSFRKVLDGGLKEVAFHIDAMRDGNLTTQPRAWGADEAAALMHTLSDMQAALRRIVGQVRNASDSIVSASTQIAGGAIDLSQRTEQSSANLEKTASAMEQIAATVKHNESTLEEATRLAGDNARVAERGGQIVGEVVATMQRINDSSGKIGEIIGTIDSIAFQTNILALNAAVEAARAGEQGRGFAVVASEVRALAQRSSSAAREIKTLITASVEQVETGTRVVHEAGTNIAEIVGTAGRVRELLAEVAVGSREQTQGVAQSAKAVQELDAVTQQNAALVEQTAAAAGALKDQARGLAQEVATFRLH